MNQKKEFVLKSFEHSVNFTELCTEYGISTKTGYKWKQRFLEDGLPGLNNQSRRPKSSPQQVSEDIICEIIKIKKIKKYWGSRKIHDIYCGAHKDDNECISRSTVERILKKAGFIEPRKRRRKVDPERIQNRVVPKAPNDLWTVDFKGWWYTPDKEKCEPLTVRDEFSKYILSIQILEKGDISSVKREFERLFIKYGMPKMIRSDNGPPFASCNGLMGLTRLSAWWLSLGILLDRIDPGCPAQNGAHERMHRDMKRELQCKIDGGLKLHQQVFDEWRKEFNTERPHEALGMKTPEEVYRKSDLQYDGTVYELEYPSGYRCRRVNDRGWLNYKGKRIFLSNVFCGYYVGMKPENDDHFVVWLNTVQIGKIDLKSYVFESTLSKSGVNTN